MASTQHGGEGEGRVSWSKELLCIFIDICNQLMERRKGKSGATISQRLPWKKVEMEFQKRTELSWNKAKLKNKYDWMRSRWSLWKQLKGRETGLGWDHSKGTIRASDEWWNLKIQENSKFETFRDEGIDSDFEYNLDQLFGYSVAGSKYAPPVGDKAQEPETEKGFLHPPLHINNAHGTSFGYKDDMDGKSDLNNCYVENVWEEIGRDSTSTPRPTQNERGERRDKRVLESDGSESNKSARTTSSRKGRATAVACEKFEALLETIKDTNIAMMNFLNLIETSKHSVEEASKYSLTDALEKICALSGLEPGTPEFSFACMLIEDPPKRIILFGLPNDAAIVEWIKFMYKERKERWRLHHRHFYI